MLQLPALAQWRTKPSAYSVYGCTGNFPSAKTGFILCSPNLFCTVDSGKTWKDAASLPRNNNLFDVFFLNDSVGWVAGGNHPNGVIYRTRDGGKTFTNNKTSLKQILKIHFINELEGWAVGNENSYTAIYHTVDGGKGWTIQYEGTDYLRTITFSSAENGWAAGDNGQLFYTKNGGKQWTQSPLGDIIHYSALEGISADTAWAGGGYQYGALYKTTNGGKKWNLVDDNTLARINFIAVINKKEMWIAGDRGTIIYSPNAGQTWLQQSISSEEDIKYIKFFSSGCGVAVGAKGTVFHYP